MLLDIVPSSVLRMFGDALTLAVCHDNDLNDSPDATILSLAHVVNHILTFSSFTILFVNKNHELSVITNKIFNPEMHRQLHFVPIFNWQCSYTVHIRLTNTSCIICIL